LISSIESRVAGANRTVKREAALALEHDADLAPADRRHHVEHVAGVDAVASDRAAIDADPQHRQAHGLLGLDVGGALHLRQHGHHLGRDALERRQVVAVDLERDVGADARDQLGHPELDRLRVAEVLRRQVALERLVELLDQLLAADCFGHGARLEHDEHVGDLDAHRDRSRSRRARSWTPPSSPPGTAG
jgi:hypothetical protein